jgi:hypothetical protein
MIDVLAKARGPNWVTFSVAASEGKKTHDRTMMWPAERKSNAAAVADPPEAQTSTPATTNQLSDILSNCSISF